MPRERRAEIAAICKRHGVTIVEDDIYGFLLPNYGPAPKKPIVAGHPEIEIDRKSVV